MTKMIKFVSKIMYFVGKHTGQDSPLHFIIVGSQQMASFHWLLR